MTEPKPLAFACLVTPGEAEGQAMLLAKSIRAFAGIHASAPIQIFFPAEGGPLSPEIITRADNLDVQLCPFQVDPAALAFPFGAKVIAAGEAEKRAIGQAELLVWLDSDSIVIREPNELLIDENKLLGYRPVDHTLIASRYDGAIDEFWQHIYRECSVPGRRIFPMRTSVDKTLIRPYFNAGMLVIRPADGFLGHWAETFSRLYHLPLFAPFYQENQLFKIFFHQAVLAGVILSSMAQEAMHLLPHLVNYPLHMHNIYPAECRSVTMNELITCRYDLALQNPAWRETITIDEPLKSWLDQQQ